MEHALALVRVWAYEQDLYAVLSDQTVRRPPLPLSGKPLRSLNAACEGRHGRGVLLPEQLDYGFSQPKREPQAS